jgi:four helix bundle protein
MATVKHFEDLEIWKLSRALCNLIGKIIDEGKFQNNFRIIVQIEGSSGSIMDNIVEGFERGTRAEFIQFLGYAKGSCGELRSQFYRALDRSYITKLQFEELVSLAIHVSSMIQNFIKYLQGSNIEGIRKKKTKP